MDADLKLFLSVFGCFLSLCFLFYLGRSCVVFQRRERQKYLAEKFRTEQESEYESGFEASPDMVQVEMPSEDFGYGVAEDELQGEKSHDAQEEDHGEDHG